MSRGWAAKSRCLRALCLGFNLASVSAALAQTCEPHWDNTIGQPGLTGTSSYASCFQFFDDGTGRGEELYVGGSFTGAGGVPVSNIARWNGQEWAPVGAGMNGTVATLALFDDRSGRGEMLYAGGGFTIAGGVEARNIARWNGSQWEPVGGGMNFAVNDLEVVDVGDVGNPLLFAGGYFTEAGGNRIPRLAAWNGVAWTAVGDEIGSHVYAIAGFDDRRGGGTALFVGGEFTTIGTLQARRIAKWDGQQWSTLGNGSRSAVHALGIFDDRRGGGLALYADGFFTDANGQETQHIGKWDGKNWSSLGDGLNHGLNAIVDFDDGTGSALFVGGGFWNAGGQPTRGVAKWNGFEWSEVGGGGLHGPYAWAYALAVKHNADGSQTLYVGGPFSGAGPNWKYPTNHVIEWRGCARPQLSVTPSCPSGGRITIEWTNATPGNQIALIFARGTGDFLIPNGRPCSGVRLGLSSQQIQLVFTGSAGANGARTINANAGPNACGGYLQLLDAASCRTSEAIRIE